MTKVKQAMKQAGRKPCKDTAKGLERYRVERVWMGGDYAVVDAHDEEEAKRIAMSADFHGGWLDAWEDVEDYEAVPVAALGPDERRRLSEWTAKE